jgi:type IV secretion system protein VirB1
MVVTLTALMAICAPLVHPMTLRALIQAESATNPYAVSINYPRHWQSTGQSLPTFGQPRDRASALQLIQLLHSAGYSTSIGLVQVNSVHVQGDMWALSQLLNPCTNLQIAQRILIECEQSQDQSGATASTRLHRTLSCYNAGNYQTGLTNGYVARVIDTARRQHVPLFLAQR